MRTIIIQSDFEIMHWDILAFIFIYFRGFHRNVLLRRFNGNVLKDLNDSEGEMEPNEFGSGEEDKNEEYFEEGEKGVFLATAHPAKFDEVYGELGMIRPVHERLEALRGKEVLSTGMNPDEVQLKEYLLRSFAN